MVLYNDHEYMIEWRGGHTYNVFVWAGKHGWLYWRDFKDRTATNSREAGDVAIEWMRSFLTHPMNREWINAHS